jgi:type II secretion system (T2SS) protein E
VEKVGWRIVGLNQQQAAKLALDVYISLIVIEVASESTQALSLVAKRIRSQVSASYSVLLLHGTCALLLPATPFSGAQALASRLVEFLANIPHEIHVYHGATATLVLQRLRESGATTVTNGTGAELATPILPPVKMEQSNQGEKKETRVVSLPYLAFLTHYPATPLLRLFPYELACHYQCAPIGAARNMLTLATCRRLNREIVAQLRTATRRGIFQVRCEVSMIDEILHYWQRLQKAPSNSADLKKDEVYSSSSR